MKTILIENQNVLVDDEDFARLSTHRWVINSGYAATSIGGGKMARMHVFVLNLLGKDYEDVDHADRNKLNNQKNNLRVCTRQQNRQNTNKMLCYGSKASRYKGVNWNKRRYYYVSRIMFSYKGKLLWRSKSQIECAYAYNVAALYLFKEFACINQLDGYTNDTIKQHVLSVVENYYGKH